MSVPVGLSLAFLFWQIFQRGAHFAMLNSRSRPTANVDLNDTESFLFFWRYLAAIGDSSVNAVDTFIVSKGKLIRWYATDVDSKCVRRHPIDLSSLSNKEFVLLVKKIFQSKKYLKVYKDKFRKSKIACVWYLDTLSTLKAVYVDEPSLLGVMNDGLNEVVCIQVLFGGKPFKNSGVFEHKYFSRADGKKTSHESYEIGLDIHADHHDHGGAYDVHIFKDCDRIVLAGTNLNKTFEKFAVKIVEFIETTARCKITNITLQIACDKSWTPYVVAARSIMLASAPYEYNTLREMLIFEDGVQPQLSSAVNSTIARLEKQCARNVLNLSALYKNIGALDDDSKVEGETKKFTESLYRSLRGSENLDEDNRLNACSFSPSMIPQIPRYKLDTAVSATRASAYQTSIRPKVVEIERPTTADSYLKAEHRLTSLTLHGHEKGKRSSGISKKLHAHALKNKCWGQFCHFSTACNYSMSEFTSVSYKSLILARAEEKYIGSEEFRAITDGVTVSDHNAFTDHGSNQIAKRILEAVANKSRLIIKQVALSSIPGFTQSLREYYDMFSRRAIYVDDYHRNHSTRLYHSSVVCNICAKMYSSLDHLRESIIFNGQVHKEKKLRPLSCRRANTREVAVDRSRKRSKSPTRGFTLPLINTNSAEQANSSKNIVEKSVASRRPTGFPGKQNIATDDDYNDDDADGVDYIGIDEEVDGRIYAKPVASRRPTGFPGKQNIADDDDDADDDGVDYVGIGEEVNDAHKVVSGNDDMDHLAENSLEMSLLTSSIDNDGNVDYNVALTVANEAVNTKEPNEGGVVGNIITEPAFLEEADRDNYKTYLENKRKSRKLHQDKLSKPKYTSTKRNIRLTTSDTLPQWLNMMRIKEKEIDKIIMDKSGIQEVSNESLYASMNSLLLLSNINDFSKIYGDSIRHAHNKKKRSMHPGNRDHDPKYKTQ